MKCKYCGEEYSENVIKYHEIRCQAKDKPQEKQETIEDVEELLDEYHTGNGWYSIPNIENKLRKEDAIKALKG